MPVCIDHDTRSFKTGIVTQLLPFCDPNVYPCNTPDYQVVNGTLNNADAITGWVLNQLSTEARDDRVLLVSEDRDPRGWWLDTFRRDGFVSGSKLWTVKYEQQPRQAAQLARVYTEQALSYLVKWGVASRVVVVSELLDYRTILLTITIYSPVSGSVKIQVNGQNAPDMGWMWSF